MADPDRLAGQAHREAALEDTYTTANTVLINSLGGEPGEALLEVTENGTGTLCSIDANCADLGADTCLSQAGAGFCTVEGCAPGSCEGSYLCCHDCADFAAELLPFDRLRLSPRFTNRGAHGHARLHLRLELPAPQDLPHPPRAEVRGPRPLRNIKV